MLTKVKKMIRSSEDIIDNIFSSISTNNNCSINSSKGTIIINGKKYEGNNVKVVNSKVYIDGVLQEDDETSAKTINITIQGDCGHITSDNCDIKISGNALSVSSTNGDISCHDVSGNVTSQNGDIDVSSSVRGKCSTQNGDIIKRFR